MPLPPTTKPKRKLHPDELGQHGEAIIGLVKDVEAGLAKQGEFDKELTIGQFAVEEGLRHEFSVIGSMFMDAGAIEAATTIFAPVLATGAQLRDLFASPAAARFAEAAMALHADGKPADFYTGCDWLLKRRKLCVGDAQFALGTVQYVFSTANTGHHAGIMVDRLRRKRIAEIGAGLTYGAFGEADLNLLVCGSATKLSAEISTNAESKVRAADAGHAAELLDGLLNPPTHEEMRGAVHWHWRGLNALAGPMLRGRIAIIAAPPNFGKTAAALQQAVHAVQVLKQNVLMILMESDANECVVRYAQQNFLVNGASITAQKLTKTDADRLIRAARAWGEMGSKLSVVTPGPCTAEDVAGFVAVWHRQNPGEALDLIVVDNISTMMSSLPGEASQSPTAITHNTLRLGAVAAEENAALLLLCQLVKGSYSGPQGRPSMGDLKGSGTPVEKAKQIIMLHYKDEDKLKGKIVPGEFVIAKANNGRPGFFKTRYIQPATLHIEDDAESSREHEQVLKMYETKGRQ